jgi:hypothetical protein
VAPRSISTVINFPLVLAGEHQMPECPVDVPISSARCVVENRREDAPSLGTFIRTFRAGCPGLNRFVQCRGLALRARDR